MRGSEKVWANDSSTSVSAVRVVVWGGGNSTEWGLWNSSGVEGREQEAEAEDNWWGLLALALVLGTAAGNILVCLAISWERRLQNVTNYFLMSLAITDLMVAVLVMPLGILTLVRGFFPLPPVYCLAWICLDVLFCTASIMHLCTISVDRYLSLRYPMKFGRNKTRRRVTLKIVFVWLLSTAMSLPLCLMYSQDYDSVLVDGVCQIPDPLYKLIGSIVSFYIPLGVMLLTYALTVRLLAVQEHRLSGGHGWSSGWLGGPPAPGTGVGVERRATWRRLLTTTRPGTVPPSHKKHHSSTDTDLTTLDTHELWLPDTEPAPSTMSALHQFGAEMLRLSRGLESAIASAASPPPPLASTVPLVKPMEPTSSGGSCSSPEEGEGDKPRVTRKGGFKRRRRANTMTGVCIQRDGGAATERRRVTSYHEPSNKYTTSESSSNEEQAKSQSQEHIVNTCRKHSGISEKDIGYTLLEGETRLLRENVPDKPAEKSNDDPLSLLPPPCTCPYFGDSEASKKSSRPTTEVVIITTTDDHLNTSALLTKPPFSRRHPSFTSNRLNDSESLSSVDTKSISSSLKSPATRSRGRPRSSVTSESSGTVVTWESPRRHGRGSSTVRTMRLSKELPTLSPKAPILRRSATLRVPNCPPPDHNLSTVLLRYGSARGGAVRTHHSRNSSVMSRTSSRHGRIIRLEQKATKVLGVVFFTFVILWAPFFVLNLLPSICAECEHQIDQGVFDFVTWLGYASSMVNPIFYTIFNKVFRQAFKKVLMCKYHRNKSWKPAR